MRPVRHHTGASSAELAALLGEGLTNKQIAAQMFLAKKQDGEELRVAAAGQVGHATRTQAAVFASKLE